MFDLGRDDTTEFTKWSSLPLEIRSSNFEIRNKFKILISKSPNRDKPEPNRKNSPQRRRGRGGRRDFLFFQMQHPTSDTLRPLRLGGEFLDRFGEDLICKGLIIYCGRNDLHQGCAEFK